MEKIIIISATNRPNSNTLIVSKIYQSILASKNIEAKILDLNILPQNIAFAESFGKRSAQFDELISEYVTPYHKFIFISPEYNGSFPGILKLFIDCVPPKEWANKRACLVGVSVGRAGNLRGMDHLTGVLNYLKMHVYHNKLPISLVDKIVNEQGKFMNEDQLKVCLNQVDGFISW
jgi:NAD(P)H-dependent FMN reductase